VSRRQTIGQVLHTLGVGGAEVLASRLAYQLQDQYRFVFACLEELNLLGEQLSDSGFKVRHIGRQSGFDWRCSARLASFLREAEVDLLHAHQYTPFFYSAIARLRYRHPPILFTEHGRPFPDYPRTKRIWANQLLLERRDRVVGVGQAVRRALIKNEGFPENRVTVICNGVDLAPFDRPMVDRDAVRGELGIAANALVVLQVARLDYLKDHATAIRTMEHIVRRRPDAHLLLVGEGTERAAVEKQVADRNLAAHVGLLGRRRDVPRLLPASDVLLLTSISEGIPLTVIEAMAAGRPVVATNVGGVGEIVEDGTTGLLAPSGDDVGLAEHVLRLADDAALRERMGEAGRRRAHALFPESRMHEEYARLYGEMLEDASKSS
jgi:glycosyltransferase involved in cell wall biosynthesis